MPHLDGFSKFIKAVEEGEHADISKTTSTRAGERDELDRDDGGVWVTSDIYASSVASQRRPAYTFTIPNSWNVRRSDEMGYDTTSEPDRNSFSSSGLTLDELYNHIESLSSDSTSES